jgi:hypothetical protein
MRWLNRLAVAAAALALLSSNAYARPSEVAAALPNAARVGEARYEVLALAVFDAELWAPQGAFSWDQAFALSLTYQRSISARALVNRTLREMTERGGDRAPLEALRSQLLACFADVRAGDRITGLSSGADTARASITMAGSAARSHRPGSDAPSLASGLMAQARIARSANVCAAADAEPWAARRCSA